MSKTYFISDTHFFHDNIIRFCNRPFIDIEHMHTRLINNWNKVVKQDDTVIIVGDFSFGKAEDTRSIVSQLKGKKILIRGNHDKNVNVGFDHVCEEMMLTIANERVLISHYPYRHTKIRRLLFKLKHLLKGVIIRDRKNWHYPEDRGLYLIHGHTHDKERIKGRMIHVGVDAWNFKPVPLQAIADLIVQSRRKNETIRRLLQSCSWLRTRTK